MPGPPALLPAPVGQLPQLRVSHGGRRGLPGPFPERVHRSPHGGTSQLPPASPRCLRRPRTSSRHTRAVSSAPNRVPAPGSRHASSVLLALTRWRHSPLQDIELGPQMDQDGGGRPPSGGVSQVAGEAGTWADGPRGRDRGPVLGAYGGGPAWRPAPRGRTQDSSETGHVPPAVSFPAPPRTEPL